MKLLLLCVIAVMPLGMTADDGPKLTFGEKDVGKPGATKERKIVCAGQIEVPRDYADPKVEVLIRRQGDTGYVVHTATLDKANWGFIGDPLPAGTYHVRVRLITVHRATETRREFELPDFTAKPNFIEVVVK